MIYLMFLKYANFVLNNAAQVSSIENGLRTLTYLLPGRFADAELASEGIYSLLNFIGLYHDKLLTKAAQEGRLADKQGERVEIQNTPFSRYHQQLSQASDIYRLVSLALTGVQFSEQLVEMLVVKKCSERRRWQVVWWIELVKVALRLNLLQLSGRRMVTGSVVAERLVDPGTLGGNTTVSRTDGGEWEGKRSRLKYRMVRDILSKSEGSASLDGYLTTEARQAEQVAPALSLIRSYGSMGLAGELLFILRPLVYVMGIRKLGPKDWRPWALSLLIELASRQMVRTDLRQSDRSVERDELSRRKWLLLYYLLRSPFFQRFTERRLSGVAEWCKNKPLLSLLGSLIQDYQPLWQNYYFYTAGS